MKRYLIVLLLFFIINLFSDDFMIFVSMHKEYTNYSFEKARYYKSQLDEDNDKYLSILHKLVDYEISLFERKKISENELNKFMIKAKKIIKKDRRKYIRENLTTMLNTIKLISIANRYYQYHIINKDMKKELVNIYKNNEIYNDFIPIFSYLLYISDFKKESIIVLNKIYSARAPKKIEKDYVFQLNLIMRMYLEKDYVEAKKLITNLTNKEYEAEFYQYHKAMPYLWLSLIFFKEGNIKKAVLNYRKFISIKTKIDKERKFQVPVKELLSPVPGVFPPQSVYDDLSNLQKEVNTPQKH